MIRKTVLKIVRYLQKKHGKSGGRCQQPAETDCNSKENANPQAASEPTSDKSDACVLKTENGTLPKEKKNEKVTEKKTAQLPYEVAMSDIMGRYLVAARDIEVGEVIITAAPLVVGPCAGCDLRCLGCCTPLAPPYAKCPGCQWPLCSEECEGRGGPVGHSAQECAALAKHARPDHEDPPGLRDLYQCIAPLRCLLLKSSDPEKWEEINKMVAHNDIRQKREALWSHNQRAVVDQIIVRWGMSQFTDEEIHTICGIFEVNAFEVGPLGASIRALYPRAFLLAHDCTPNTNHTDDRRRHITIRSALRIPRGAAITLSYAYTLQSTHKRREHLRESKFFECFCERCSDPKELGSYCGALLCPECTGKGSKGNGGAEGASPGGGPASPEGGTPVGTVLPTAPLDDTAPWRCVTCVNYEIKSSAVRALVQRLNDEYDGIDVSDVDGFESFVGRYRSVLHPSHYLCLASKHALSQLYGKVDGHLIHQMSLEELARKRDICREILQIFNIIEPGASRLRGITLYELHAPLMILTTRDFEKRAISKADLRVRLREVAECLNEAARILCMEPKHSAEGIMASAALDALRRIKDWEKLIGKI